MPSHLQRAAVSINRVRSKVSHQSWKKLFLRHVAGTTSPGPHPVRKKDHLRAQVESNSLWSIHFLLPNFQIVFRKHPVACSMFFNRLQWLILESRQTSQVLRFMSGVSLWLKANCYTTFTFRFWKWYIYIYIYNYTYIYIYIYIIIYIIYRVIVYQYFWWLVSRLFTGQSHFGDSLKKSPSHFGD